MQTENPLTCSMVCEGEKLFVIECLPFFAVLAVAEQLGVIVLVGYLKVHPVVLVVRRCFFDDLMTEHQGKLFSGDAGNLIGLLVF